MGDHVLVSRCLSDLYDRPHRCLTTRMIQPSGSPTNPHDHGEVRTVVTVSDDTDGLEATSRALPGFRAACW
jgi:hypothetical protein